MSTDSPFERFNKPMDAPPGPRENPTLSLGNSTLADIRRVNGTNTNDAMKSQPSTIDFSQHKDIYPGAGAIVEAKQDSLENIVNAILARGGGNSGQSRVKTRLN